MSVCIQLVVLLPIIVSIAFIIVSIVLLAGHDYNTVKFNQSTDTPTTVTPTATMTPTASPTTVSPTHIPTTTMTPTVSPTTVSPTDTPTFSPTRSPTFISGNVTCCFAVTQRLVEFWIDEVNITSSVATISEDVGSISYEVTFVEPHYTTVMVIKGFESSEVFYAGLRLMCVCTRQDSPWNFNSSLDSGFRSISTIRDPSFQADNFREGYYLKGYSGPSSNAIEFSGPAFSLNLTSLRCGMADPANSLGHPQGLQSPRSWYWGLRREVIQPSIPSSPTMLPTLLPTYSPTFPAPTMSPSTSVPTKTPTKADIVTCCFNAIMYINEFWVNEVNMTGLIDPPLTPEYSAYLTRHVTFVEPVYEAVIGISGYTDIEVLSPSLALRCNSTNATSNWNIISKRETGPYSWKALLKMTNEYPYFTSNWYKVGYDSFEPPSSYAETNSYGINDDCGPYSGDTVKPAQYSTSQHWALRRLIKGRLF